MSALLFALLVAATPVSEHATDTCVGNTCTRKIQNDINYKDASDVLHASEDGVVAAGPYLFKGTNFQYRKRSRLTFYGGDLDATGNKTTVAVQVTNKPAIWLAYKLVGATNVGWNVQDGRTLRWDNALPNCDLYFRAGRRGIRQLLTCTATPGVGYMEIEMIIPDAALVVDTGSGWEISGGGATVRVDEGVVWDSANGNYNGLDLEGTPITSVTTLESDTPGPGSTRSLIFRVNPTNAEVTASFGAGRTVFVRLL